MSNSKQELSDLFKNIHSCLQHCTIPELNTAITKVLSNKKVVSNCEEVETIILVTCDHFNISRRKIMAKHSGVDAKTAREIAMCLIYKKAGLNQRVIASYFDVSSRIVNMAVRKHKTLDYAIKWDKEFGEHYCSIEKKLDRKKEANEQKEN